ncbi:MAG TPA: ribosome biogenesis GTP-binding protein YihA/YsxC, partial [Bacteroidales bacterium]|nr:ribosome biogenesis GTP-binding protein YihA/YsxC [Bacteroidales bacterium]
PGGAASDSVPGSLAFGAGPGRDVTGACSDFIRAADPGLVRRRVVEDLIRPKVQGNLRRGGFGRVAAVNEIVSLAASEVPADRSGLSLEAEGLAHQLPRNGDRTGAGHHHHDHRAGGNVIDKAGVKGLARTSATPVKTRLLNYDMVENLWYLVDLPGYGFAKISKSERERWEHLIHDYVLHRKSLLYTFVLIDSRIEPQQSDLAFINWMGKHQLPLCLVFTKTDKLSRNKIHANVTAYKKELEKEWDELPTIFISSSVSGLGKAELTEFIQNCNHEFGSLITATEP